MARCAISPTRAVRAPRGEAMTDLLRKFLRQIAAANAQLVCAINRVGKPL
jgi:hypothetical protein